MSEFNVAAANKLLKDAFAPWLLDLNIEVTEVGQKKAVLRMPFSERLCRDGGIICGQALISLADTAMVIAVVGASGGYRPMTTVDLSAHFMKPTSNRAVICTASVMRLGRSMAFVHILLNGEGDESPVVSATTACAFIGLATSQTSGK